MNTIKEKYIDKDLLEILNEMDLSTADQEGGTDKASDHNYTSTYALFLSEKRNEKINLVEIGVWHGGSIAMWTKYMPNANFLFYDISYQIKPKAKKYFDEDRMKLHIMDAYTFEAVEIAKNRFPDGIDFLLDDGPHTLNSMVEVVSLYSPLMKAGGTLMIEDVQRIEWTDTLAKICPINAKFDVFDMRETGRYDDIIVTYTFNKG